MNAWVRKEIKDSIRWLPVGMVLLAGLLSYQTLASSANYQSFRSESLYTLVWFLSAAFATFLGLANYLPETWGSARGFLVQRGLSLHRIFVIRAVVNFAVYLIAMLVPLGSLAVYLSVISPNTAPVNPILVVPSVVVVLFCFSFYFGAVAVACRPCRWYGSRLFPLLASFAISFASVPIWSLHVYPYGCVIVFLLGIIGMLLLATASRLAFLRGPSQPAPSRTRNISIYEKGMMFTAVLVATVIFAAFVSTFFMSSIHYSNVYVKFTNNGTPWLVETRNVFRNGIGQQISEAKFPITESTDDIGSKPDVQDLFSGQSFDYGRWYYATNYWDMQYVGYFTSADGNHLNVMGFRGFLYVYQQGALQQNRLIAVVGKDLVGDLGTPQIPFDHIPRLLTSRTFYSSPSNGSFVFDGNANASIPLKVGSFAIAATDGIYHVDLQAAKIDRLLDVNVRAYCLSTRADGTSLENQLAIWDGGSISMFQTKGQTLNGQFQVGERITTLATPTDIARRLQSGDVSFDYRDPDNWSIAIGISDRSSYLKQEYEVARSIQKEIQHYTVKVPHSLSASHEEGRKRQVLLSSSLLPPIVLVTFGTASYFLDGWIPEEFLYLGFLFSQAVLSGILATLAARWRGLSARQIAGWCAGGCLIGLGAWFLVLSIYPRVVYAKCPACNRNRRIEGEKCESCDAAWEPIPPLGIEVFEERSLGAEVLEDRLVASEVS